MSVQEALDKFRNGFNCSQAVFSANSEKLGISMNNSLRIASGFGAGMGGLQNTCGAVTGAFMLIGSKYCNLDDGTSKQTIKQLVKDFNNQFIKKYDSINCLKLLGCDLNTDAGKALFKDNKLREVKCEKYIEDACRIVEKMLDD